jgi:hypothetical protein
MRHPKTAAWPPGLGHHGDLGSIAKPKARKANPNQPHTSIFDSAHAADAWIAAQAAKKAGLHVPPPQYHNPGKLAKQLQMVHHIAGKKMNDMGKYMHKSIEEIQQMGTRAKTGKMAPLPTKRPNLIEHAKEVKKIMESMQSAGNSVVTKDFVRKQIHSDMNELDKLGARAHGVDLSKKPPPAPKPTLQNDVKEVEKIMGTVTSFITMVLDGDKARKDPY